MAKLSIIIPVKNLEGSIRDCLKSILRQTYRDYEIIMVFDNCADRSKGIAAEFLKNTPHMFIDVNYNRAALSRNAGLEKAAGEYIWFIDGDDRLADDNAFQIVMDFFHETGATVVSLTDIENCVHGEKPVVWRKIFSRQLIGNTRFTNMRICESYSFYNELRLKPGFKECHIGGKLYSYTVNRPDSVTNVFLLVQKALKKALRKSKPD